MKLIIQIPCYNEEHQLPVTLAQLPRQIDGIDLIERLVIDDGSKDRTVEVAREHGVEHIIRHVTNKGLAAAFQTGLNTCLKLGADIIVNTDADNQYPGEYIPALVAPILENRADMVVADRQINSIAHFSPVKKRLQRLGSTVVRYASRTTVPDAPSGFRALSREAALRMNVITSYTYTLETIIQAGRRNLTVTSVPIRVNATTRESRLIRSIPSYIGRSVLTIAKLFILYEPLRFFTWVCFPFFFVGTALWVRYFIIWLQGESERSSHVQSLILASGSLIIALVIFMIGIIGDLIAINRRFHEETLYYVKKLTFERQEPETKAIDESPIS